MFFAGCNSNRKKTDGSFQCRRLSTWILLESTSPNPLHLIAEKKLKRVS